MFQFITYIIFDLMKHQLCFKDENKNLSAVSVSLPDVKFHANLNNNEGFLSNVCGVAAVGSVSYGTYKWANGGTWKHFFGGLFTGGIFGCASYALRKDDQKYKEKHSKVVVEDAIYEEIKEPTVQAVNEIREKVLDISEGYDAGQLIGKLLYQGDRAILYAPHGVGKSVVGVQMAIDISLGQKSLLAPEDNGVHTHQEVLYYDGEMDEKDYYNITGDKDLSSLYNLKLIRGFYFENVDKWLDDVNKRIAACTSNAVVFLDNLTCICSTINAETIRKLFLNKLKIIQDDALKRNITVTFVVLAHTNKQQELAGSSNLSNFATTVLGLEKHDDMHILLHVDKMRKYGDIQGKTFLLEKKQTADGYKYDELVKEIGGEEPQVSPESNESAKPEWKGKLSLGVARKMKEFYKPGIKGHGYKPAAEEFGLNHASEAQRELQKLEIYEAELVASEADYCQQDER